MPPAVKFSAGRNDQGWDTDKLVRSFYVWIGFTHSIIFWLLYGASCLVTQNSVLGEDMPVAKAGCKNASFGFMAGLSSQNIGASKRIIFY